MQNIKRGYFIDSCDAQTVVGIKTRIQSGFILKLITLLALVAGMQLTAIELIQTIQFDANCNASALQFNLMTEDTNGSVGLSNLTNFANLKPESNLFTSDVLLEIASGENEFYKCNKYRIFWDVWREGLRGSEIRQNISEAGNDSEHVWFRSNSNCNVGLIKVNDWYLLRTIKKVCNLILRSNYKFCKSRFFYSYNLLSASNFGLQRLNYKVNKPFLN